MLADTAREAAQRVPAVATVRWVGTPQWPISLVREQMTVSRVMLADTVLEAAQRVPAVATVPRVDTPR